MNLVYPKSVKKGDTIGLVLPSSMIDSVTLDKVKNALSCMGLSYKVGTTMQRAVEMFTIQQSGAGEKNIASWPEVKRSEYQKHVSSGYMAGDPRGRANDINNFFADPEIDAIWCLRGGYSSSQIMPYLDYELIRNSTKLILGYSDVTNVICGIHRNAGLATYHAPMLTPNWTKSALTSNDWVDEYTEKYFNKFIMSDWVEVQIDNPSGVELKTLSEGAANGKIVAGNLTELARAVGTNYLPDTDGAIVFLEEVRTHVVLCDMALTQLDNSGFFDNVAGVVLGDFLDCHNRTGNDKCQDWGIDNVLINHFTNRNFPVLSGLKFGHDKQTATLPLGASCQIDTSDKSIVVSR